MNTDKDWRDGLGCYTLRGVALSLEAAARDGGWPDEFLVALKDFVTDLYGDEPRNFMGPNLLEAGGGYDNGAPWVELVFEDEREDGSGYRDVIGLRWESGRMRARCVVSHNLTYEGSAGVLQVMKDRGAVTVGGLNGDGDGNWRPGDLVIVPHDFPQLSEGRPMTARAAVVTKVDGDFVTVDKFTGGSGSGLAISRTCDDAILRNRDRMESLLKKRFGAGPELSARLSAAAERYAHGRRIMEEAERELAAGFGTLPRDIPWDAIAADLR